MRYMHVRSSAGEGIFQVAKKNDTRSDITPNPGGHRPHIPVQLGLSYRFSGHVRRPTRYGG